MAIRGGLILVGIVSALLSWNYGTIAILDGSKDIERRFDHVYKYEHGEPLEGLEVDKLNKYTTEREINYIRGTALPATTIPAPIAIYSPGIAKFNSFTKGKFRNRKEKLVKIGETESVTKDDLLYRRNLDGLNKKETTAIRDALRAYKADDSISGFLQLGALHGSDTWCPYPDAPVKNMCCHHKTMTFPAWHRLLMINFENGLRRNGYKSGVPYWEWTRPMKYLPSLASDQFYTDLNGELRVNPFLGCYIERIGQNTARDVDGKLYQQPAPGKHTELYEKVMYALEQENFEDFEIHMEIAHDMVHLLIGGNDTYSMAYLKFAAYDPIFYLHHSMVDRIWATWQALQKLRGKPYYTRDKEFFMPMSPFNLSRAVNVDYSTRQYSYAINVFDYKENFNYEYDSLGLNGMTVSQLLTEIKRRRSTERVFASVMLRNLQQPYIVQFYIRADGSNDRVLAGQFSVFGSRHERAWQLNRRYKTDVTKVIDKLGLLYTDQYHIEQEIIGINGELLSDITLLLDIVFQPRNNS